MVDNHINEWRTATLLGVCESIEQYLNPQRFCCKTKHENLFRPSNNCSVVKEEIADDSTILPCFNGRAVSWVSKVHRLRRYIFHFKSLWHPPKTITNSPTFSNFSARHCRWIESIG